MGAAAKKTAAINPTVIATIPSSSTTVNVNASDT